LKPINLENGKLTIDDKIKFYFWINVAGVCTMADPQTNQVSPIFNQYKYLKVTPKQTNGYKLMTDKKEMMKLILPTLPSSQDIASGENGLAEGSPKQDEMFEENKEEPITRGVSSPSIAKKKKDPSKQEKRNQLKLLRGINAISDDFYSTQSNPKTVPQVFMDFP
jgi:hypothetical protein